MNITEILTRLLDDPEAIPDDGMLAALREEYPYLTLPSALALKRGAASLSPQQRAALMQQVALNAAGRDTLFRLLDPDGKKIDELARRSADTRRPAPAATTEKAIDLFLETYGRMEPREEALLEKMIFNPVPDYTSMLEREAAATPRPAPSSEQDRLLDSYLREEDRKNQPRLPAVDSPGKPAAPPLKSTPPSSTHTPPPPTRNQTPGGSLSESLARIYIRQRRFDKAYDIIHHLSLNNPEKSVYFADQLRFLQKLMLNSRFRTARN